MASGFSLNMEAITKISRWASGSPIGNGWSSTIDNGPTLALAHSRRPIRHRSKPRHASRLESLKHAADANSLVLRHRWLADDFHRPAARVMQRQQPPSRIEHRRAGRARL